MVRPRARTAIVFAAALLFCGAAGKRFHWLGGPYFRIPETIQDHVWPTPFASRDAIVVCRRAAPLLPRGAEVTVLTPSEAPEYDQTHWLTGLGLLVHQHVVPQKLDVPKPPEYVIAVRDPFPDPRYVRIAVFPEGGLYRRTQ